MSHFRSHDRLLTVAVPLALCALLGDAYAEPVSMDAMQPVEPTPIESAAPGGSPMDGKLPAERNDHAGALPVEPGPINGVASAGAPITRGIPVIQPGGNPAKPDVDAIPAALELVTPEDQSVKLDFGASFAALKVIVPPAHGTLLTDRTPFEYVPASDFNGEDSVVFGAEKPEVVVSIKVLPVNDPPRFEAGSGRAHAAPVGGIREVPGWAAQITAGPRDEAWSQRVFFSTAEVADPAGVVSWLEVAPDGTLRYALTGQPGTASWTVQAFDNGWNMDGGVSVSALHTLRIGVGVEADLAIKLSKVDPPAEGHVGYQIIVSNLDKADVLGARVADLPPAGASTLTWKCEGLRGGSCPSVASGTGPIDVQVDLPGDSMVVFHVSGTKSAFPGGLHTAFVEPPSDVIDPDLSNNEAAL